jgi:hypothetical protein
LEPRPAQAILFVRRILSDNEWNDIKKADVAVIPVSLCC